MHQFNNTSKLILRSALEKVPLRHEEEKQQQLDKIEEEIIAKDFTDPTVSEADLERLMEKEE